MKITDDFFDDLDSDLEISATDLDQEWLRQPQMYMKYAMASAHFKRLAAEASEKAKIIEAELKAEAAEDPDACLGKGVKPSNEKIAAYAAQHPSFIKARQVVVSANYRSDMAMSAVFAFQQRKDALENLVRLVGMEYFSSPQVKLNVDREFDKTARQRAGADAVRKERSRRRS